MKKPKIHQHHHPRPLASTLAHQRPADVSIGGATSEGFEKSPLRRTSSDTRDWDLGPHREAAGRQCPTSAAKLESCSKPGGGAENTPRCGVKPSGGVCIRR